MDSLRVALVQMRHGDAFEDNLARARGWIGEAAAAGAKVVLLPEYWFAVFPPPREGFDAWAPRVRAFLADASRAHDVAVAGNVIERSDGALRNVGVAYDRGVRVLEQVKIHPMPREAASGIQGGARLRVSAVRGLSTGMLVCADVLYPEAARVLALQGALLLLNPVMSPWRAVDNTKEARGSIFVARAYDSGAFVLKAAGLRRPAGEPPFGIAGRSLVAAPWGVLARHRDEFEEELLVADLDLARLREFRDHQSTFPKRRPDAYDGLL